MLYRVFRTETLQLQRYYEQRKTYINIGTKILKESEFIMQNKILETIKRNIVIFQKFDILDSEILKYLINGKISVINDFNFTLNMKNALIK